MWVQNACPIFIDFPTLRSIVPHLVSVSIYDLFKLTLHTLMQLELELLDKECFLLLLFKPFQNDVGLFISPLNDLERNPPFLS